MARPAPFKETQFQYARELMPEGARVLDYGCGDGAFLQYVAGKIREGIGIDLDEGLVAQANRTNAYAHVHCVCADGRSGLPFGNNSFDVITALGVLEHVGREQPYLEEFFRVLRPEGTLVIEVPSNGLFRWLDVGNVKYKFPTLHRWFYVHIARQPKYYEQHFGCGSRMCGQFSKDATQHRHYGLVEIVKLLQPRFEVQRYLKYGVFFELIQFMEIVASRAVRLSDTGVFRRLLDRDCKIHGGPAGANLTLCAKPVKATGGGANPKRRAER